MTRIESLQEYLTRREHARREDAARRRAATLGFDLKKSRRRDRSAPDFGLYAVIDPVSGFSALYVPGWARSEYVATLEQVEEWLDDAEVEVDACTP